MAGRLRVFATVTPVRPPVKYGTLEHDGRPVQQFSEKPPGDGESINGGFSVRSAANITRIEGDKSGTKQI